MTLKIKYLSKMMGLIVTCPFINRAPDCPLRVTENLEPTEKYKWLNDLSPAKLNKYLIHHEECYNKRRQEYQL